MTWPNITLKRGITQNDTLLAWLNKSSGEQFAAGGNRLTRSTAAITLLGPSGGRLRAWEFDGAFPVKWKGPDFAVSSADMATEELEITHHGFRAKSLA
jgi:phage tail-like protein